MRRDEFAKKKCQAHDLYMRATVIFAVLLTCSFCSAQTTAPANGYPALQKLLAKLKAENDSLKQQVAKLNAHNAALQEQVNKISEQQAKQKAITSDGAKIGMSEQDALACFDKSDYTKIVEEDSETKVIEVYSMSIHPGVPPSRRTICYLVIDKQSGKVTRIKKPS